MRSRYKIAELEAPHFITCTIVGWLPVFTRHKISGHYHCLSKLLPTTKGAAPPCLCHSRQSSSLVVSSDNLSQVIRDFKRHTAKEILAVARQEDKQWLLKQFEFFKSVHKGNRDPVSRSGRRDSTPRLITTEDMLRQKLEYIHYNPVRIGLVDRPEDWRYSSARNYFGQDGVLEIDSIEL